MIKRIKTYVQEVSAEMAKVTWPPRSEVRGATVVVIVAVGLISVFIFLVDRSLNVLLGFILH